MFPTAARALKPQRALAIKTRLDDAALAAPVAASRSPVKNRELGLARRWLHAAKHDVATLVFQLGQHFRSRTLGRLPVCALQQTDEEILGLCSRRKRRCRNAGGQNH